MFFFFCTRSNSSFVVVKNISFKSCFTSSIVTASSNASGNALLDHDKFSAYLSEMFFFCDDDRPSSSSCSIEDSTLLVSLLIRFGKEDDLAMLCFSFLFTETVYLYVWPTPFSFTYIAYI